MNSVPAVGKASREQLVYLEARARVENATSTRDYRQLIAEHSTIMIDMLRAMACKPMRVSAIAHIGARAQQNAEEWRDLIADEGIESVAEWRDVHDAIVGEQYSGQHTRQRLHDIAFGILSRATDDLVDFMQVGSMWGENAFLARQKTGTGRALGYFCALSGKWRKQYDAQRGDDVAKTIQRHWVNYVKSLISFTKTIKGSIGRVQPASDTRIYHHCTMVLLHADALGKEWADWVQ